MSGRALEERTSSPEPARSVVVPPDRGAAAARPGPEARFRAFIAFFAAAFLLWVVVKPTGERGLVWLSDLVLPTAALLAGGVTLRAAVAMGGRERRSWLLIGLGAISWGLGMTAWSYDELILEEKTPFPSLADLGYLTMIPLMFAGLVTLPGGERRPEGRIKVGLDALIVIASIATVSWFALLGPVYTQLDKTWLEKVIGAAYPVGDVLLLCALVGGLARGWIAARDPALLPLALGIGLFSVSDSVFAYLTLHDAYQGGHPIDVGWSTGFLLIAYAALRRRAGGPAAPEPPAERRWAAAARRRVPYALVLGVTGLVFASGFPEREFSQSVFLALALTTVGLLLARQFVTLRENERLNRELLTLSQRLEDLVAERTARLQILHTVAAALGVASSTDEVCRAGLQALLEAEDGRSAALHLREGDRFIVAATYPQDAPIVSVGAVPAEVASTSGEEVLFFPGSRPGRGSIWVPVSERGQLLGFIGVAGARLSDGIDTRTLATIGAELGLAYQNQRRIEESNRRELELVQSDARTDKLRALGQMASGVAHDLNQSLAMVMGYSDFARLSLDQPTPDVVKLRQMLEIVIRAAATGSETVKRLLIFARPRQESPPESVDVAALLRDVAQLTAPRWRDVAQAEGRQISMLVDSADDLTIEGWSAALRDALTNLVFNAVDALPQGGTIRLRCARRDDAVEVEVSDSGVGMSPDVRARIFEPFFTTKGDRGTGLGLAQVFSAVERHRGRISVRSAPGQGTTFELRFPAAEAPEPFLSARPVPAGAGPPPRVRLPRTNRPERPGLRILAVDDEPYLRDLVALMLERDGHAVVTTATGEQALERLGDTAFDLVISDIGLGSGINGWELGRRVRARFPGVRFALATGWGAQIDPAEARASGVEAVIPKPYRLADLRRLSKAAPPDRTAVVPSK